MKHIVTFLLVALVVPAFTQVHYHEDGSPWNRKANGGPDAVVDGWYLNLGVTGLRAQLMPDEPNHLLVKHVLQGSPALGRIRPGDVLLGVGGKPFETPHRNGYGMDVFGAHGPTLELANAIHDSLEGERGRLELEVRSGDKSGKVTLRLPRRAGSFSPTFPEDCKKSDAVLERLLDYLVEHQQKDGSWGTPTQNTFAPLALLASGKKGHLAAVKRNARYHAITTSATDQSSLIHWRYMAAAIVLSEYHLATGEKWVVPELQEIYDYLHSTQYVDLDQVNPRVKETHPSSWPKDAMDQHGGWGHNPGFEGYGPICMITGQGALAFALMARCGIEVDRERHEAAYAFLARGTGKNGYVWYEDSVAGDDKYADMGRTGAAGIANALAPYDDAVYRERARAHAEVIGKHPESFPDTHGSPLMGMGYAALAAWQDPPSWRRMMDANRWWFTLSECPDGSFYYQPNRDNAGYGADSRLKASAVTAFILSIPKRSLVVTGKGQATTTDER